MLAAWLLQGLVAADTGVRVANSRRAVNLSFDSNKTLGSSPARLLIAGALNFVEGST